MKEISSKNRPFLIFFVTILFLIGLSFLLRNVRILGYEIKPVDLFIDIKPDSLLDYSFNENQVEKLPIKFVQNIDNIFEENFRYSQNTLTSSVSYKLIRMMLGNIGIPIFYKQSDEPNFNRVQISGSTEQLSYFFNALKNAKKEKVRIAHYGDSGIEGDLITADIRKKLQNEFGGEGAGILSITSQDIMFRSTTKQTFSDNWKTYNVVEGDPEKLPLGINGFVSVPEGKSWVKYQATQEYNNTSYFKMVRIFYTNAKNSVIHYSFNNAAEQSVALEPGKGVKEITLNCKNKATSFKLITTMANQAEFFGVSLESGNGVYVDNFPWRGNTGVAFRDLNVPALKDFDKLCNYKLIILGFGGNVVSPIAKNYNWYKNEMIKNIKLLKGIFPNTSFLLLGASDKSVKRGSRFVTNPGIPLLIKTQEEIAKETGIAFWNVFEAMGGKNSMEKWVYANPPLAMKDFTHVTAQGAAKIGEMIAQAILDAYNKSK